MRKWRLWHYFRSLPLPIMVAMVLITCAFAPAAYAVTSSSTNYKVSETQFGGGSTTQTCSGQYCASTSVGGVSNNTGTAGSSPSFGTLTGDDPRIEMIVDPGDSNLGVLKTDHTTTQTSTVQIRNYLNNGGYALQIIGDPPKANGHTLATSSTAVASRAGTEQFGMNLVANSSPNVGADPVQQPSGAVTFGQAASGYNTANRFKYVNEDTIAQGVAKTGRTDYTITIILNISGATPAGQYKGSYQIVAIPVF